MQKLLHPQIPLFTLSPLTKKDISTAVQRVATYTLILVTKGKGKLMANAFQHDFSDNAIMCFSPYEPFKIVARKLSGYKLTFHPDFLCVYKHHQEVACNGVLFDNIYYPSLLLLKRNSSHELVSLIRQMKNELKSDKLAKQEVLVSLLKIFLITATRVKASLHATVQTGLVEAKEPTVLRKLKDAIEGNYKKKHSTGEYAEMLHISSRALSNLTKIHFKKRPSDMISERICIEAKRELYLTSKSVKQIAFTLGFQDEFYFSRFFKNKANISPHFYRSTIGYAKAEGM